MHVILRQDAGINSSKGSDSTLFAHTETTQEFKQKVVDASLTVETPPPMQGPATTKVPQRPSVSIKLEEGDAPADLKIDFRKRLFDCNVKDFVKSVFARAPENYVRKLIDQLIVMTPLRFSSQFSTAYPYSRELPSLSDSNPRQRSFKIFLDIVPGGQVPLRQAVIITIQAATNQKVRQQIVGRTGLGQVFFFCEGYDLNELPEEVITLVQSFFTVVILQNRDKRISMDSSQLSPIFKQCKPSIWVENHEFSNEEDMRACLQGLAKSGLTGAIVDMMLIVMESEKHAGQTANLVFEKITYLRDYQSLLSDAINIQSPGLRNSICPYIQFIIGNSEIIGRQMEFNRNQIQLYPLVSFLTVSLIELFLPPTVEPNYSLHFPTMLKYPKYCHVCKKDHKEAFPESTKRSINIKKTKYGCQGCSFFFKTQIRLCVLCFKKFHLNLNYYMAKNPSSYGETPLPAPYGKRKPSNQSLVSDQKTQALKTELIKLGTILKSIKEGFPEPFDI